jgi:hypothetical protein
MPARRGDTRPAGAASRSSQFLGGDSGWWRNAMADDAEARWRDGIVALAAAVEAAVAAAEDPASAQHVGARLASLHDAVCGHLADLDELAAGGAGGSEYRAYAAGLRHFRDALQAWRFSRGEGRPRADGPPPVLPVAGELPMPHFANSAWCMVGDAMLLMELHGPQDAERPDEPPPPWWRRWLQLLRGKPG